jgi:tetratricopeptide (TPR) repeat protein
MLRRRFLLEWSLLSVLAGGVAFAAPPTSTVAPGSPSAAAAPKKMDSAQIDALVQQASAALAAGDFKLARDTFLDVVQADSKNARALHGLSLAYYQLGDLPKAAATIDRAVMIPGALDHALALNAGTIHLAAKNPVRAAKIAKDYLTAKPNPVNEPLANVLAIALDRADAQARKNAFYNDTKAFYTSYVKRMETANPGFMRFGTQWLPADKVAEYNRTNATNQPLVDRTTRELAELEATLTNRREQLEQVNDRIAKGYVLSSAAWPMQQEIQQLEQKRDDKKKILDEATAKLVKPAEMTEMTALVSMDATPPPLSKPVIDTPAANAVASNDPNPANSGPTTRRTVRFRRPPGDEGSKPAAEKDTPTAVKPPPAQPTPPPTKVQQPTDTPAQPNDPPPAQGNNPPAVDPPPAAPKQKVKLTTYAAAFAVSQDLVVTTSAAVDGAGKISLQARDGNVLTGEVVRTDPASGLALVRVKGIKLTFLDLGTPEAGKVTCLAFADANIFAPTAEQLAGTASAPAPAWTIRFTRHPRLAGAPLLQNGKVVGIAMGDRDSEMAAYPALPADAIRKLLDGDAPKTASTLTDPLYAILQLSATKEREQ